MYSRVKKYFGLFIVLSFVYVIGSSLYAEMTKKNPYASATRISCQKRTTTFEKVYKKPQIQIGQNQVKSGNVVFSSSVLKATYAKSKLFEYVKLSEMDKVLEDALKSYIKEEKQKDEKLNITYYIYENDVKDPGKKTEKSKLYAGYVVFKFYNQKDEIIYQVQIDFMDKKGDDLAQSIECAIKSFMKL